MKTLSRAKAESVNDFLEIRNVLRSRRDVLLALNNIEDESKIEAIEFKGYEEYESIFNALDRLSDIERRLDENLS